MRNTVLSKNEDLIKLRCVIIDDEPDAIRLLQKLLVDFCADKTELMGTALGSTEGMKLLGKTHPDLVFLDIEMPGASGFDLIDMQNSRGFKVVFVTAYDRHAIKAIKYKPDGYILKPIDIAELVSTVDNIHNETFNRETDRLGANKYSISVKEETILVNYSDILFVKASGRYSDIYLVSNKVVNVCKNIGHIEKELVRKCFVRCHKSYLVNPVHIVKFKKGDGGFIEISNGTAIEVSRRRKTSLFG